MTTVLGYCLCYILGAGTVIFSFKAFNPKDRPTEPASDSEPLNEEITAKEREREEQLEALWNYDPFKLPDKGGELNEKD